MTFRSGTPDPDRNVSNDDPAVEHDAGSKKRFNLESLEPRILLSGDPVLAELARVAEAAAQDDINSPSVIVEEIDAALSAEIGLHGLNGAPSEAAPRAAFSWPSNWSNSGVEKESGNAAENRGEANAENDPVVSVENVSEESAVYDAEIQPGSGSAVRGICRHLRRRARVTRDGRVRQPEC